MSLQAHALLSFAVEVLIGFAISFAVGTLLLQLLPSWQFKQIVYEDAPQSHQQKAGTPTMGGLAILGALAPCFMLLHDSIVAALLFLIFACGAIGFLDDYLSVARGKNLGLRSRTKYLATALIAIMFLRMIDRGDGMLFHAGWGILIVPHWLWLILGILAITGTIHAVNLTDGLDGLASGTILPPLVVLWEIAVAGGIVMFVRSWPVVLTLAIGGILGFLVYNRHRAKLFMGDTGSLALGALLAGAAIVDGEMLLLILIGGVFVAEALSVILQVSYFKATGGKRIFRMSPLHHHFELGGWPETKVTTRFWLASLLFSVLGLAVVR